jgi:hypothetical protein
MSQNTCTSEVGVLSPLITANRVPYHPIFSDEAVAPPLKNGVTASIDLHDQEMSSAKRGKYLTRRSRPEMLPRQRSGWSPFAEHDRETVREAMMCLLIR